jgi:hypothetical protein
MNLNKHNHFTLRISQVFTQLLTYQELAFGTVLVKIIFQGLVLSCYEIYQEII